MGRREQQQIMQAYADASTRIRASILTSVLAAFGQLGSWRDADMERFGRQQIPRITGAQRQMATTTSAYLRAIYADALGLPRPRAAAAPQIGERLRGIPQEELYERPFRQIWQDLGDGKSWEDSYEHGLARLEWILTTDLQLAKTHTAQEVLDEQDEVKFYRRVLKGPASCGLCVVASTQRYFKADLLPIHPGCDCYPVQIITSHDPGQVINEPLLENVHDAIAKTFGKADRGARAPDYRDFIVTHVHGEIGPVLRRRDDKFTGPGDLGKTDDDKPPF